MRNVITIFHREVSSYFNGPLAYIVIPSFLMLVGVFSLFFQDIFASGVLSLRVVFFWSAISFLFLIPAITMRSFAEELKTGSIEMLVTLPVTDSQVVFGKYLAALFLVTIALLMTVSYPWTLSGLGELDWGAVLGGYLGLFLLGASFTAIGVAASATSGSQVIAFLLALIGCLAPFTIGFALSRVPAEILPVVQYFSFEYHFNNLARGVLDSRDLIFYGTVVAFFLHFAVFQLERRRLK
jgi:ABC-2 type transport system permease protein